MAIVRDSFDYDTRNMTTASLRDWERDQRAKEEHYYRMKMREDEDAMRRSVMQSPILVPVLNPVAPAYLPSDNPILLLLKR